jgi:alpha-tubulin suppressor-like RCC1 family protein
MLVVLPAEAHPRDPWQIAVGGYHTMIYKPAGPILGFGYNLNNQLGDWSWENKRRPVPTFRTIQ